MSDQSIEVPGARLAYDVRGSGPTVVYAHGLMASRRREDADGLFGLDPVVDAGFRLVRYDARGHGESTGSNDPDDWGWDRLAGDLLTLLQTVSPDEPVAAVGCSMGTATILHAVLQQPERFSRLVLTGPPTAWQTRAAQAGTYRAMADALESGDQAALERLFALAVTPEIFADRPDPVPDVEFSLFPAVLRGAAGTDLPSPEQLATIDTPTLVAPWASDPGHPLSTAETLVEVMPRASLRVAGTSAEVSELGRWAAEFLTGRTG